MVLLGVLLTVGLCLLLDRWLGRAEAPPAAAAPDAGRQPPALGPPESLDGLRWQPELGYHPGHAWVLPLSPRRVRIGIDDVVAGWIPADGVQLPAAGGVLVQGLPGWRLQAGARRVAVLSPVSGRVVARNEALAADAAALRADPYGAGWLLEVEVPDLAAQSGNLLYGAAARRWLRGAPRRRPGLREVVRTHG